MPTVSFDGQSFLVDGRRVWLVSGAIHYPRTPRPLWRRRIRAARQAGLNCIETYVFWNVHEPRPGVFNFEGDADLRDFVQTIAQEGMYCILRPGPYVCSEWDFGGFPAWLHRLEGVKLRQANPAYLEACARYLGAVMEQVKDLQVTAPVLSGAMLTAGTAPGLVPAAGPIIMVQAENEWFCHHPQQAGQYLAELARYLREDGCEVPINGCNNLWQRVEGVMDTWNANAHLAADLRQLRIVQPNAPRIVTEFWPGWFDPWGQEHHTAFDADLNLYRLAQILASGAQYNLYMFHGGTNFGFYGGRTVAGPDCYMTTSYDYDAPLLEAGGRGDKYLAVKRISTFASQFAQLFAGLEPARHHAAVALTEKEHPVSVIHQTGSQGDVVFLIRGRDDTTAIVELLLPNGLKLPVPLGDDRAAWVVLNANLAGVAQLTYTNLRPWAFLGKRLLVLFGPAGAEGLVSIDSASLHLTVPTGREPLIQQHEGLTLVVLNRQQVDAAYIAPNALVVGAAGLDDADQPLPHPDWPSPRVIDFSGNVASRPGRPAPRPAAPRLTNWRQARLDDLLCGESNEYQSIDGPASLEALQCDYGYGWYCLTTSGGFGGGRLLAPQAGDRLHVFTKGKPTALLGLGPGADYEPTSLSLKSPIVVLADNLGRFNYGWLVGEKKGLFGHIYAVKPLKLGAPKVVPGKSPNPFVLGAYWTCLRVGESHPADSLVWNVSASGKEPLILDILRYPLRAMLFVNQKPVGLYDPGLTAGIGRFVLRVGEELKPGRNEINLALFDRFAPKSHDGQAGQFSRFVRLYQAVANLTAKAQWAFAKWTVPGAGAFGPARASGGKPCWYRGQFSVAAAEVPLWLEIRGMSKGQLYLNGHNVGRYWVATASGKAVPPQTRYYLPEPWLRVGQPNELLLFDEHGKSAAGCKLVYDPMGPYGG